MSHGEWSLDDSVSWQQLRKCTSPNDHKGIEEELRSGRLNYARSYFLPTGFLRTQQAFLFLISQGGKKNLLVEKEAQLLLAFPVCRPEQRVSQHCLVFLRLIEKFQR
jgi:hypothetical protein